MIAIFGASGFLGSYVFKHFAAKNAATVGTYCTRPAAGLLRFDLACDNVRTLALGQRGVRAAIIATGETNIDAIKQTAGHCAEVNVRGTCRLIDGLREENILPIYISTDCVFDGRRGNYREEDTRTPQTIYGQQKVAVEDYVMRSDKPYLIVRISKIHSSVLEEKNWLGTWVAALSVGQSIVSAIDQIFCPTHVTDVAEGIDALLTAHARGIFHVASPVSYSKYDVACELCRELGVATTVIRKVKLNELGLAEVRPLNTSLVSEKFIASTRRVFKNLRSAVQQLQVVCP